MSELPKELNFPRKRALPLLFAKHKGTGIHMPVTRIREENAEAVRLAGLDAAIIGIGRQYPRKPVLVYSAKRIVRQFMQQGMTHKEALDFFNYSIDGLYRGENTPVIVQDMTAETVEENPPTDQIRKDDHALTPRCVERRSSDQERHHIPRIPGRVRRTDHQFSAAPAGRYGRRRTGASRAVRQVFQRKGHSG